GALQGGRVQERIDVRQPRGPVEERTRFRIRRSDWFEAQQRIDPGEVAVRICCAARVLVGRQIRSHGTDQRLIRYYPPPSQRVDGSRYLWQRHGQQLAEPLGKRK